MNFPELMFYAESNGDLPTRRGRLNAVIRDIKAVPSPTIDSDTLVSILTKNGIDIKDLTQEEFRYILRGLN